MTAAQFRSNPEYVGRMRQLLSDPTLATAIVCVQGERPGSDLDNLNSDALVSVRVLNRQIGYDDAINQLLALAQPVPTEIPDEQATFGVDPAKFRFVPPPTEPQPA